MHVWTIPWRQALCRLYQSRHPIVPLGGAAAVTVPWGAVLRLAGHAGIPTRVTRLTVDDVATADEVFLTGTAVGIQPVGRFLDTRYRDDRPVTGALADACGRLVMSHREKESSWEASA